MEGALAPDDDDDLVVAPSIYIPSTRFSVVAVVSPAAETAGIIVILLLGVAGVLVGIGGFVLIGYFAVRGILKLLGYIG